MERDYFMEECFKGGPGLDGYAFRADVYCCECAKEIAEKKKLWEKIKSVDDCLFSDSDTIPQPIFFEESDCKQYCGQCEEYLYGQDIKELL